MIGIAVVGSSSSNIIVTVQQMKFNVIRISLLMEKIGCMFDPRVYGL